MHEVLVNRLGGLSLPRKSVVRLNDRPDMTLDVYRGRKTTMQQQQPSHHVLPGITDDPFEKNVTEESLPYNCCSESFSYAVIHLDCTCSIVIELLSGVN